MAIRFRSFSSIMQLGFSAAIPLNHYYWGLIGMGFLAIAICFAWNTRSSESSTQVTKICCRTFILDAGLWSLAKYLLSVHEVQYRYVTILVTSTGCLWCDYGESEGRSLLLTLRSSRH